MVTVIGSLRYGNTVPLLLCGSVIGSPPFATICPASSKYDNASTAEVQGRGVHNAGVVCVCTSSSVLVSRRNRLVDFHLTLTVVTLVDGLDGVLVSVPAMVCEKMPVSLVVNHH